MSRMLTFLLVGVAIGVLIAPEKGAATRARLADFFNDVTDDAGDLADDFVSKVKDRADDLKAMK